MQIVPKATSVCPPLFGTARARRRRSRRGATPPSCQASRRIVKPTSATSTPKSKGNCSIFMRSLKCKKRGT